MEKEVFDKELKKIEDKMVLSLNAWWGESDFPGYDGIIVTDNKEVYKYQYLYILQEEIDGKEIYIKKVKDLTEEEYEKITLYMQNEFLTKEFEDSMMFDAGYDIKINYNGVKKTIENDIDIYNKTKLFLEELLNLTDI